MNKYPITYDNLEIHYWKKLVQVNFGHSEMNSQFFIKLTDIINILQRIIDLPLEQTLDKSVQEFFIGQIFPNMCLKIFKIKLEEENQVQKFNEVIQLLTSSYIKLLDSFKNNQHFLNKFISIFDILFDINHQLYQNHNLIKYSPYTWKHYNATQENSFLETLKIGDKIDAIKYDNFVQKVCWSWASIKEIKQNSIVIKFCGEQKMQYQIDKLSIEIAPFQMFSDYQWRLELIKGSNVEYCNDFKEWNHSCVVDQLTTEQGKFVKLMIDDRDSEQQKHDHNEWVNVTSPRIQKQGASCYRYKQQGIHQQQITFPIDDNDTLIQTVGGQRIFVVYRVIYCSKIIHIIATNFIENRCFQRILQNIQQFFNIELLNSLISILIKISPMLHKTYFKQIVGRINITISKCLSKKQKIDFYKINYCKNVLCKIYNLNMRILSNSQQKMNLFIQTKLKICDLYFQKQYNQNNTLKHEVNQIIEFKKKFTKQNIEYLRQQIINKKLVYLHIQYLDTFKKIFMLFFESQPITQSELNQILKTTENIQKQNKGTIYLLLNQIQTFLKKDSINYLIDYLIQTPFERLQQKGFQLLANISKQSNYKIQQIFDFCWKTSTNKTVSSSIFQRAIGILTISYKNNNILTTYIKRNIKTYLLNLSISKLDAATKILYCVFSKFNIVQDQDILKQVQQIDQIIYNVILQKTDSTKDLLISTRLLNLLKLAVNNNFPIFLKLEVLFKIIDLGKKSQCMKDRKFIKKWYLSIVKQQNVFVENDWIQLQQIHINYDQTKKIEKMTKYDFDLFKSIFIVENQKKGYLQIKKNNPHKIKNYDLKCNFYSLQFYDTLTRIFYQSKGAISLLVFKFYSDFYLLQKLTSIERQKYLTQSLEKLFRFYDENNIVAINRSLQLIQLIIDQSEKEGEVRIESLNKQSQDENLTLDINSEFQINISHNDTFINLRKQIAKTKKKVWKQINVFNQKQENNICNNKLIKNLFTNKKIKVNIISPPQNHKIRQNNIFCKQTVSAFKIIFNNFSTNGLIQKQKYMNFLQILGQKWRVQKRTLDFYKTYDDDRDGFINFNNLIRYYNETQQNRIWQHFNKMNIRYDLKSLDDPDVDLLQNSFLTRETLVKNTQFVEVLLNLLKNHRTSCSSWRILSELPIIQSMKQHVLKHYKQIKYDLKNPFEILIYLHIYWYLLHSKNEKQTSWKLQFLQNKGYQKLFDFLIQIMQDKRKCNQNLMSQAKMRIVNQTLDIVYEFIFIGFKRQASNTIDAYLKNNNKHYLISYYPQMFESEKSIFPLQQLLKFECQHTAPLNIPTTLLIDWIQKLLVHKTQKRKQVVIKCLKIIVILLITQQTCLPLLANIFEIFFSYENIVALQDSILFFLDKLFYSMEINQQSMIINYLIKLLNPKYRNIFIKIVDLPFFHTFESLFIKFLKQIPSHKIDQQTLTILFASIIQLKNEKMINLSLSVLLKVQFKQVKIQLIQNLCKHYFLSNSMISFQLKTNIIDFIFKMIKIHTIKDKVAWIIIKTMEKYKQFYHQRKEANQTLNTYDNDVIIINFYVEFIKGKFSERIYQEIIKISLQLVSTIWIKYQTRVLIILKRIRMYYTINQKWEKQFLQKREIILLLKGPLSQRVQKLLLQELIRIINKLIDKNNLLLQKSNELDTILTSFLDSLLNQLLNIDNTAILFFKFWRQFIGIGLNKIKCQYILKESNLLKFVTFFSKHKQIKKQKTIKHLNFYNPPQKQINDFYYLLARVIRIVSIHLNSEKSITSEFIKIILNIDFLCLTLAIINLEKHDVAKLFEQLNKLCIDNILISERIALVFLRVFHNKHSNIFKLLSQYLMIDDNLRKHRVKWIFGHSQINIKPNEKTLAFYDVNSKDIVNLYSYNSTLAFDKTESLLECIIKGKINEVFTFEILKFLFTLCKDNKFFLDEVLSLHSPNYIDKDFNCFLYTKFIKNNFEGPPINCSQQIKILIKQIVILYKESTLINYIQQQTTLDVQIKPLLFPIKFKYIQTLSSSFRELLVQNHSSQLLLSTISKENKNEKDIKKYQGIFIENKMQINYRFRWEYGVGYLKSGESKFLESDKIVEMWACENKEQLWSSDMLLKK